MDAGKLNKSGLISAVTTAVIQSEDWSQWYSQMAFTDGSLGQPAFNAGNSGGMKIIPQESSRACALLLAATACEERPVSFNLSWAHSPYTNSSHLHTHGLPSYLQEMPAYAQAEATCVLASSTRIGPTLPRGLAEWLPFLILVSSTAGLVYSGSYQRCR